MNEMYQALVLITDKVRTRLPSQNPAIDSMTIDGLNIRVDFRFSEAYACVNQANLTLLPSVDVEWTDDPLPDLIRNNGITGHGYTPPGYWPCSRFPGHTGPCAHERKTYPTP